MPTSKPDYDNLLTLLRTNQIERTRFLTHLVDIARPYRDVFGDPAYKRECWIWKGLCMHGIAMYRVANPARVENPRARRVLIGAIHRLVYFIRVAPDEEDHGQHIVQICENGKCTNAAHIQLKAEMTAEERVTTKRDELQEVMIALNLSDTVQAQILAQYDLGVNTSLMPTVPTCRNGHPITPTNTKITNRGETFCKTCYNARMRRYRAKTANVRPERMF